MGELAHILSTVYSAFPERVKYGVIFDMQFAEGNGMLLSCEPRETSLRLSLHSDGHVQSLRTYEPQCHTSSMAGPQCIAFQS